MPIDTKQILANTLLELCRDQPLDKIRPADIARACNVSRQTFYNHFHDKQDVVEYIFLSNLGDPVEQFDDYTRWSIKSGMEIERNWWFYSMAARCTDFWSWHERWLFDNMLEYVRIRYGEEAVTEELRHSLQTWLAGTCAAFPVQKRRNPSLHCAVASVRNHRNMPALLLQYFPFNEDALEELPS